jgi:predicted PurR-regulated permease PerM
MNSEGRFYPRLFGIVTAALLGLALMRMAQPFLGPVLWAALLAFMLFPLHARLRKALGGRDTVAAVLMTVGVMLVVVVPVAVVGGVFGKQASDLVSRLSSSAGLAQIGQPSDVLKWPAVDQVIQWVGTWVPVTKEQAQESMISAGRQLLQSIAAGAGSFFASVLGAVLGAFLTVFLFFFFVRDGEQMVGRAMALVPLDDRRKGELLSHLSNVLQAVVLGSLVTALVQGTLVGIGFAIAGLPWATVFAVLAIGASLIPIVGTAMVWIPAALWLFVSGHPGLGVFLAIWGAVVVSSADNVVRPLFVSSRASMSTLPVFIGIIGGVSAFGAIGAVLGPVVIALALALVRFTEETRKESATERLQVPQP